MKANTHNASATDTQFHFVGEGTEFRALHGKPDGEGVPQIIPADVLDSCFAHGWAKTRSTKLWVSRWFFALAFGKTHGHVSRRGMLRRIARAVSFSVTVRASDLLVTAVVDSEGGLRVREEIDRPW